MCRFFICMKKYLELVKFAHTIFALPFAIVGFLLAYFRYDVSQPFRLLMLIIACMVFARSAAMAFNRLVDRNIDAKNPRTKNRELPAGTLQVNQVRLFVLLNCLAFMICTYFINRLCFYLSPVALALILGYSYTKRFTYLCHYILGLGLSLAPIGAYLAVGGTFDLLPILFSAIVFSWVSGFDMLYAMQDASSDASDQLYSIPSRLGGKNAFLISSITHVITALLLCWATYLMQMEYTEVNGWVWAGTAFFIGLLLYQHLIISPSDISKINRAFFTANGVASIVLMSFVILDFFI